jgi:NDP-sugar pyrophosphorylase family protein
MNHDFSFTHTEKAKPDLVASFTSKGILHLPLLDKDGRPQGIFFAEDLLESRLKSNLFVIMAGGSGLRMRPHTLKTPKPILEVGGKGILQRIIESAKAHGFYRFAISINFLGDQIKNFLGDGSRFQAQISYLEESEPLGTAGAILHLGKVEQETILVTNGDLLTDLDFLDMLEFHDKNSGNVTVATKKHDIPNPYGVIQVDKMGNIGSLVEKPTVTSLINAGIYALNPLSLTKYPENRYFNMTDLIQSELMLGTKVIAYEGDFFWFDIGTQEDLNKANYASQPLKSSEE